MHYVIGDVHGCYKELQLLLKKIECQDEEAVIYFVGDWIDRGPQVAEVMDWVVKHITTDGKYRSVRGNHDQDALEWYEEEFIPWSVEKHGPGDSIPETYYDFSDVVDKDFNRDPKAIEPFFEKVKTAMPYNVVVDIETPSGAKIKYRICHAWHRTSFAGGREATDEEIIESNLYERYYWGYFADDEIIVHGHTPTILHDYILRGKRTDRPGLIGYRHNDIDVDGGCCYQSEFTEYACMLCGICLETLEEFYSYDLLERLFEVNKPKLERMAKRNIKWGEITDDDIIEICNETVKKYNNKQTSNYRRQMLERLGQ